MHSPADHAAHGACLNACRAAALLGSAACGMLIACQDSSRAHCSAAQHAHLGNAALRPWHLVNSCQDCCPDLSHGCLGVLGQHEGGGARDVRHSHAGALELGVLVARESGGDVSAWSVQVDIFAAGGGGVRKSELGR
jgi:hypothetical protein